VNIISFQTAPIILTHPVYRRTVNEGEPQELTVIVSRDIGAS